MDLNKQSNDRKKIFFRVNVWSELDAIKLNLTLKFQQCMFDHWIFKCFPRNVREITLPRKAPYYLDHDDNHFRVTPNALYYAPLHYLQIPLF